MGATDDRAKSCVSAGMQLRFSRRALGISTPLPPVSRRGVFHIRAAAGLASAGRVGLRAADVSTRAERRLCRPFRWRLPAGPVAVDAGLSARRSPFFGGLAAPDAHPGAARGTVRDDGGWRRGVQLALA